MDITKRTAFTGAPHALVDAEMCCGCGDCLIGCRFDALSMSADGCAVIDPWLCESCGACALACPNGAIGFEPQVAGEILEGSGPAGPIVFGRLRPGEDLSGKLVTSVRERAAEIGRDCGAALILIDGPPGVGCPAIASMTGADAVLAVTEPSRSGEHDLRRLATLAGQLNVPVTVLLNKADLSASGADRIRQTCLELQLELVGEVPFDSDLPGALEAVAQGTRPFADLDALPSVSALNGVRARVDAMTINLTGVGQGVPR